MKRKFKLLSSIASVSLAVALLVIGAFAAGPRNVGINGFVSFTATRVEADVTVYQAYGTWTPGYFDETEQTEVPFEFDFEEYTEVDYAGDGSQEDPYLYTQEFRTDIETGNQEGYDVELGTKSDDGNPTTIMLNDDDQTAYSYKIVVENKFSDDNHTYIVVEWVYDGTVITEGDGGDIEDHELFGAFEITFAYNIYTTGSYEDKNTVYSSSFPEIADTLTAGKTGEYFVYVRLINPALMPQYLNLGLTSNITLSPWQSEE